jgi:D-inositol-3-phosphate glycosyltransferase
VRETGVRVKVALLTGGGDPHYARGLVRQLLARQVHVALIAWNELADCRDAGTDRVEFHDFFGTPDPDAGPIRKVWPVLRYYGRIIAFATRTDARLFHILWFRKFPSIERTLLNGYFKLLGKKLVFTAHNVDDRARDGRKGSFANKLSLRFLYKSVDHIFVHTPRMKCELMEEFGMQGEKVTVVPLGINDVIPPSHVNRSAAKQRLGFGRDERVVLFFGHIAPYKGVEDLIRALARFLEDGQQLTLVLAGRVNKSQESYWRELTALIDDLGVTACVRKEIRYIPDEDVGLLFRASDVSVLPYRRVYQSGVLALSYAQGAPVIVADVGSLKDDVIEGETGFVYRPGDAHDLAAKLRTYFASDLFKDLETRSEKIREYGAERFSWARNAEITCAVYERVLRA